MKHTNGSETEKEGERDSNNKMNVQLHVSGKNSFVVR